MAPAYAKLFMGDFERKALQNYPDKPHVWLRYIDDILMVWTHGEETLDEFLKCLNNLTYALLLNSLVNAQQRLFLS